MLAATANTRPALQILPAIDIITRRVSALIGQRSSYHHLRPRILQSHHQLRRRL
jgi:hypothetical protein